MVITAPVNFKSSILMPKTALQALNGTIFFHDNNGIPESYRGQTLFRLFRYQTLANEPFAVQPDTTGLGADLISPICQAGLVCFE
jgi:hypothetical protein